MYLKSIDMQGFKSFPDKIKIAFDDGVTVIVGPNGSGKSNICDAIRWVLGEQSSRTLRGLKMEDVIFNGTQKRSAVGFAEVSLTLNNKEGILKSDYDEITVTRRFYRSGESEYYINRTQVRLKDIHELFMDTGLGRDGYSIVGQGRIAEILSAKSEDRRQIFEEAAGIIKYRTRKEEAQKKLSNTEDNIVRINDIVSELEGRIEPLALASQKAKQYLEFYEELKNLEINQWLAEIDQLKETVERCGMEYERALAELKKSESEADSIDSRIEELYEDMRSKDAQAERARGHIKELEQRLSDMTAKIAVLQNDVKNDQANVDRIEKEIEREQNRSGSIDDEIEGLGQKIQNIAQGISEDENSLQSLLLHSGDLSSKEQGVESEISQKSARLAELIALVSDLKISISALSATLFSNEERRKALSEELLSLSREKDKLAKELSDTEREKEEQKEEIEAADNVFSGYQKKQENAQKRYDEAFAKNQEIVKQIDAKRARLTLLSDLQKDYDGYTKSVKMVMQQRETGRLKGIVAPVSRLIKSDDEYATAIEIALGASSQNIVVENEQSAKAVISFLKSTEGGRATFMPLSSVSGAEMNADSLKTNAGFIGMASSLVKFDPRFSGIIQNLLGRTVVVDHIDNGLFMASQNNYRLRIVTLDGQLLNPGGSITGGSLNKSFGLLSRANEIERLKNLLAALQEDYKAKSREESFYKQELDKINAQLEGCVMQKTRAVQLLEVLEAKSTGLRSNMELLNMRLDGASKELDTIGQKDRQTKEQMNQNQNKSEELSASVEQINESIRLLQAQKSDVTDLKEELSQKIMELKLDINSKNKDIESARSAIESLREQKEMAAVSRQRYTEQITQLCCKIEEIKGQINSHTMIMEELKASIGTQEELVQSLIQKKLLSEQKISGLQKESISQRNLLLSLQKEYARCESRLAAAKSAEDTIINKMWDSYEISLTAAKKYLNKDMDLSRAPRRISSLKGEIKGLGNVNIDSIEEYREVKERYAFITAQRDDLTRAKEGLLDIVCEMTEKMKIMFKSQFSVISEEFSRTFTELFGGGKASLVLSDPDDVLESGIEINVQPPGKNVKNISLLSGGEQAFVAIAILFAILKIKPTPFCVFDEIEAALDDVNVARFAGYIEKYSDKTQFILISHRRGTMEAADILYGVTMQERGVSKLLSININEVEKRFNIR